MKFILIFLSFILFFTACSNQKPKELKIATNSWIGYAPLFYAKERGYLDKINVNLVYTVSLAEASNIFEVGKADMVTTTQHEYNSLKHDIPSLTPIILLDRSNGGDIILSNRSIRELKEVKSISAYLEIDSINTELMQSFTNKNGIDSSKITYINRDQAKIQNVKATTEDNIIIATYSPYDITLRDKGFKILASTKDMDYLLVVDSICTTKKIINENRDRLKELKLIIDRSISELQSDTNQSYLLTSKYLSNISYDEYLKSLKLIKWINKPSKKLLHRIEKLGYIENGLIK